MRIIIVIDVVVGCQYFCRSVILLSINHIQSNIDVCVIRLFSDYIFAHTCVSGCEI